MFKRLIINALASIAALVATQAQPGVAANPHYAPFPSRMPFRYYGKLNGKSRKRRSNRLRISKMTRNKHR